MPESIGDAPLGVLAISDGGPAVAALMLGFTIGDQALLGGGPAAPAVFLADVALGSMTPSETPAGSATVADSSLGSSLTSDTSL